MGEDAPMARPGGRDLRRHRRAPAWTNGGIVLAAPPLDRPLAIRFPLKVQQLTVSQKVHIHPIRVSLKGDQVTAMDHFGMPLNFFPPFP